MTTWMSSCKCTRSYSAEKEPLEVTVLVSNKWRTAHGYTTSCKIGDWQVPPQHAAESVLIYSNVIFSGRSYKNIAALRHMRLNSLILSNSNFNHLFYEVVWYMFQTVSLHSLKLGNNRNGSPAKLTTFSEDTSLTYHLILHRMKFVGLCQPKDYPDQMAFERMFLLNSEILASGGLSQNITDFQ